MAQPERTAAVPGHTVILLPQGNRLEVQPEETLLGAVARQRPGLVLAGCKGGGCGVCKVRVLEGQVAMGPCSVAVLPDADRAAGLVLACQATPLSDLLVETVERPRRWQPGRGG